MNPWRIRRRAAGLGLAASLLALLVQLSRVAEPVEQVATDLLMRVRGRVAPDPRVVVCDIDAESVRRHGRWPWSRALVAGLVDRLAAGGPRVVAMDVLFAEPSRADAACNLTFEDPVLARSLARAGNVVLGYLYRHAPASARAAGSGPGAPPPPPSRARTRVEDVREPARGGFDIPRRPDVTRNLDLFADA